MPQPNKRQPKPKSVHVLENEEFLVSIDEFKKCAMPFEVWVKNKKNQNEFLLSWCRSLDVALECVEHYLKTYYRKEA